MNVTEEIRNFDDYRTLVSDDMLRDALDLYEAALDIVVKNPPRDINDRIPGLGEWNLADSIIDTYYRQNPGFCYRNIREGFSSEQLQTMANLQNDKETREYLRKKEERKRYR